MSPPDSSGGVAPQSDAGRRTPVELGRPDESRRAAWLALDQSSIMTVELLAAICTWGGIGLLLDRWLGVAPWLSAFGVLLGLAAGLYLVWLRSAQMLRQEAAAARALTAAPTRPPAAAPTRPPTEGPARARS